MPNDLWLYNLKNLSAAELYDIFFPKDSRFLIRPIGCSELAWNNHEYALFGIICHLKSFFINTPFSEMIKEYVPTYLASLRHLEKHYTAKHSFDDAAIDISNTLMKYKSPSAFTFENDIREHIKIVL